MLKNFQRLLRKSQKLIVNFVILMREILELIKNWQKLFRECFKLIENFTMVSQKDFNSRDLSKIDGKIFAGDKEFHYLG